MYVVSAGVMVMCVIYIYIYIYVCIYINTNVYIHTYVHFGMIGLDVFCVGVACMQQWFRRICMHEYVFVHM
jgi:hypothetical protein